MIVAVLAVGDLFFQETHFLVHLFGVSVDGHRKQIVEVVDGVHHVSEVQVEVLSTGQLPACANIDYTNALFRLQLSCKGVCKETRVVGPDAAVHFTLFVLEYQGERDGIH